MNRSSLRYKIYKHSIEKNLTSSQREMILSESFLSKVGAFLGLGGEVGGALANAFKNSEVQTITKSMKSDFQDLKKIASKLDNGDQVVIGLLKTLLADVGFDPSKIAQADLSKLSGKEAGKSQESGPVTSAEIDKNPEVAAKLVAAMTDKKPEDVSAAIATKKPNAASVSQTIAKAISGKIGLEVDKTTKVVKALMDTGHIVFENRRPVFLMPDPIIDRWQTLAGIDSMLAERNKQKNKKAGSNPASAAKPATGSTEKPATGSTEKPVTGSTEKPVTGSTEKPDENLEKKKKEFEKPLKDIRGKVKEDDVSDEDIFKVFDAIISAGGDGKGPEIK
jgi:hypothetical protein